MCSTKCVSPNGQIETEGIKAITKVTSNIAETVNSKFIDAYDVVLRCQTALSDYFGEVQQFMNAFATCLKFHEEHLVSSEGKPLTLKEKDEINIAVANYHSPFEGGLESGVEDYMMKADYPFDIKYLQFLSRRDCEGLRELQPRTDPSKKICDVLEKVDNTTKERFDLLVKGLKNLEDNFQDETEYMKKNRKIREKLLTLQDLIMDRNFRIQGKSGDRKRFEFDE